MFLSTSAPQQDSMGTSRSHPSWCKHCRQGRPGPGSPHCSTRGSQRLPRHTPRSRRRHRRRTNSHRHQHRPAALVGEETRPGCGNPRRQWWQQQGPCLRQSSVLPDDTDGEIRPRFCLVLMRRDHAASATLLSCGFQHDALGCGERHVHKSGGDASTPSAAGKSRAR